VLERADLAHASHHLDAERHRPILLLQSLAQLAELLDDGRERVLARASEQEAGMEDDELGAARGCDAGGMVEHAGRHVELLAALGVAHEAGERRGDGERDPGVPREPAERRGEAVVHPELLLEVDLAGGESAHEPRLDRRLGALARGHSCGSELDPSHSVRSSFYVFGMAKHPSRIDLLELDIDLRLADLWRGGAALSGGDTHAVGALPR